MNLRVTRDSSLMGIRMLDHIIIGDGEYYSFVNDTR